MWPEPVSDCDYEGGNIYKLTIVTRTLHMKHRWFMKKNQDANSIICAIFYFSHFLRRGKACKMTLKLIQDGAGEWRREVAVCDSLCDSVGSVV